MRWGMSPISPRKKFVARKPRLTLLGVSAGHHDHAIFRGDNALYRRDRAGGTVWNSFVVNMFSNDQPEKMVDLLLAHRPDGIIYTAMGLRQVPVPEKLHA